ncbi:hypothetical protein F5878DRAFT_680019 [Lentinula raphanica]|uniref:MYND-type domain-containing protein n=1 Tax=Lentinula raphanica TaxID=153919 RepID=A0AA38PAJ9_9AGAR|nr:hypothetical protein F5878DRAFT_680019 [Lentinula raphanica]
MSQPLYWLGKYYFYGIGNTPTISLTRDFPPETSANLLLLGCGDIRNVLFTVYNENSQIKRHLDITCNDMDPGIIARDILLLTMIIDNIPSSAIWNIYLDLKIDRDTHTTLLSHCRKLCKISRSQKDWENSEYGPVIKISTAYTLEEACRHWRLYMEMENLPLDRKTTIGEAFEKQRQKAIDASGVPGITFLSARAAGPLMLQAVPLYSEHLVHYATTGISSVDPKVQVAATLLNPTFAYSFVGEGWDLHYATSPLIPFHSAELFGNAKYTLSMQDLVLAAQKQFKKWCNAFYIHLKFQPLRLTLRFVIAEATALCKAFYEMKIQHHLQTGISVSQWKSTKIIFDSAQYGSSPNPAPSSFDVIDTSNLVDHIGLLNVLVSTIPLHTEIGVIYTESLLYKGDNATKEFTEQLFADLGTVSLLLGVVPIDYLSGFSTRSNTHELLLQPVLQKYNGTRQFHQVVTWKSMTSACIIAAAQHAVCFDNMQLGTFLWDMYNSMFEEESKLMAKPQAIAMSNLINYNRESFVLFLRLVQLNLSLSTEDWESVMERFINLQESSDTMIMDTLNRPDFYAYLHKYGVYTISTYHTSLHQVGWFARWSRVPQLVRIVLTVPRSVLDTIFKGSNVGTPTLQCTVVGSSFTKVFSAVHAAFGKVFTMGTESSPQLRFEEDGNGWKGSSPLVLLAANNESQANLKVNLQIRNTAAAFGQLGLDLNVFSANLWDETYVHILPESSFKVSPLSLVPVIRMPQDIGPYCEIIMQNPSVVQSFGSLGAIPKVEQLSLCIVRITVSEVSQDIAFPYPVQGKDHRLRVARKSLYIELLVPPSGPSRSGGLSPQPFLTLLPSSQCPAVRTWNIHYVGNLAYLPSIDCSQPDELYKWLNPHVSMMMSAKERIPRKKLEQKKDLMLNVKDTLHSIIVRASGIQGGRARHVFALLDKATRNTDTMLFVNGLRYDQSAHTVVCDAFILPSLAKVHTDRNNVPPFAKLIDAGDVCHDPLVEGELTLWKHLIPAFVERCRSWSHGANCEYKAMGRIPLTEEMDENPICSCGEGKNVDEMSKVALWKPFARYATRIAISPLFAVSYLEPILRDINSRRCLCCRKKGKFECGGCRKVRYCSQECQRKDWAAHKKKCHV